MRVLLVKTSSLGDLIHTFPALTDARRAMARIRFDWLVEESFAEVPAWHPAVDEVIPIALRRWRGNWRQAWGRGDLSRFTKRLRQTRYDLILDAQGLLKSALPAFLALGPGAGFDSRSAREPLAAWTYRRRYAVAREQHAIERLRQLFALALGYPLPVCPPDYGLHFSSAHPADVQRLILLHGTTWPSKHWPEPYWAELARIATDKGFSVYLPWGDPDDRLRAERIIKVARVGELLPRQGLSEMARTLAGASGVVGVDSGLAHLAAAVGVPAITLYGSTRVDLTGALGPRQRNLAAEFVCAPCMRRNCDYRGSGAVQPACFETLDPARVFDALRTQMDIQAA
jgi:heptosyltransferase-1